ncbi:response regulator [Photobacterium nomapromontoriensis]|uniref:response regulator n=1 Tax=Photobacterium nomapromontoriensis TaxID=2910237 RepID=UPI003D12D38E
MPTQQTLNTAIPKNTLRSLKILIIDDQRVAATMLKNVLGRIGVQDITISLNYEHAINKCCQHVYDILFVDYHLDGILNGSELISLLRRRKHISPHCGIIMISGDRSTEVILTSLSVEPDSFITKPVTIEMVRRNLTATLNTCALRAPIYNAIESDGITKAISVCKQQLKQSGYHKKIEGLLLDLMIKDNQWQQVKTYSDILERRNPSPILGLIQAKYEHHHGKTTAAIHILEKQIAISPLNIDLYDQLACYLEQNKQYYDALDIAKKALKLTPSISHRALKVAELAANLEQIDVLATTGTTLANHLPIIDVGWIICFAEYIAIFEKAYFKNHSITFRHKLKQQLAIISNKAHARILPSQQPFFTSYSHIITARLALGNGQTLKAKRRLLIGLSTYFDQISCLPSVMLADALPVLIHFGETQLIAEFNRTLANRDQFDPHSESRLKDIRDNAVIINSVQSVEVQLANSYQQLQQAPSAAMAIYEAIIDAYPLCSEANLGRLECMITLNLVDNKKLKHSLQAIASMPLPDQQSQWRDRLFDIMATQLVTPQQVSLALPYKKRTQQFRLTYSS